MKAIIFLLIFSSSYASVWETTNSWNDQFLEEQKEWMESAQVKTDMFTSAGSKYYGIKVDCADVTYALQAIFAFENGLPYQVKNPIYRNGHKYKYWSNTISKFDNYTKGIKRLVAYVNFLGDSLGTETLSVNDSYPIKMKSITSADVYMYKKNNNGAYLRHAYNIKNITDTGNFQLIWSNQQRKKDGRPMKYAEWSKLSNRPYKYAWGFRRFKKPSDFTTQVSSLSDYSTEQFSLAKKMDDDQFFTYVNEQLKLYDEDPNTNLTRHLENICNLSKDRIEVVKSSTLYSKQINGRCMNYNEYDEYSTPSRDSRLLDQFNKMKLSLKNYIDSGDESQIDFYLLTRVKKILDNSLGKENYCQFEYKSGQKINIQYIYNNLINGKLSSHPNDNIDRRWGVLVGSKTNCKAYY